MKEKRYILRLKDSEIAQILVGLDICLDYDNIQYRETKKYNKEIEDLINKIRKQRDKN
jgi:hypothetical protein